MKMDAETMYYLQDIQLHSVEEARRDFAEVLSDMKSPERKFYFCHMELKDTHEQVGSIGYTVEADTPVGKLVHLGYFTYPRHWLHLGGIEEGSGICLHTRQCVQSYNRVSGRE